MKEERTQIIVDEIKYWREHKLLPAVYCDFLIALYTKGEGDHGPKPFRTKRLFSIPIILMIIVGLLILSFFVIYLGDQSKGLTITLLGIIWCFALLMLLFMRKKARQNGFFSMSLLAFLLLTLLHSFYIGTSLLSGAWLTGLIILLNFFIWLLISYKMRYRWLMFTSLVGLVFTIFYIVL